jgi:glyoxylase-like metal-dependent hydrolase (beta-lactamase superfamily II)
MPRILRVTATIGAAALSLTLAGAVIQTAAQQSDVVKMQTLNVRDILYVLTGGGGNTLALMRDDGVVLVDTKSKAGGRGVRETIQAVTDGPVTTIINTHGHPDHVAGNLEFADATKIIAHERTKAAMQSMAEFSGTNARSLPNTLVSDRLSLLDGNDRIDIYHFGRGHTDGDLVVVFPEKRLAHLGDLFPGKAAPVIDTAHGGSAVEIVKTLDRIVSEIKGVVRVTTGHDQSSLVPANAGNPSAIFANPKPMTWDDVVEYAGFNRDFLAAVQDSIKAGKSAADAAASLKLPDKYKGYGLTQARANVEAIYRELKK